MMQAIKKEDELREKLRREAMISNKSSLDRQVLQNRERRQIAESLNNSMQRTFATGLPLNNDYGMMSLTQYDEATSGVSMMRNGFLGRKKSEERSSQIREELRRQMASNEERRRREKEEDDRYGQRLNFMVRKMQKQEAERQHRQKEMHY